MLYIIDGNGSSILFSNNLLMCEKGSLSENKAKTNCETNYIFLENRLNELSPRKS